MDDTQHTQQVDDQTVEQASDDSGAVTAEDAAKQVDDAIGSVLDSYGFSGDSDDSDHEADDSSNEESGEVASDEEVQGDGITNEQAVDALLKANFSMDDIRELSSDQILKIGTRHFKPDDTSDTDTDESDDTDQQESGESLTAEQLVEQVTAELGDEFEPSESAAISRAITKAVELNANLSSGADSIREDLQSKVDEVKGLRGHIELMSREIERLSIESSRSILAQTYPKLGESGSMDAVVQKAKEYVSTSGSVHEALEKAALVLFGAEQTRAIQKHQQKVSGAKRSGTPNPGRSNDNKIGSGDSIKDAAMKVVLENM